MRVTRATWALGIALAGLALLAPMASAQDVPEGNWINLFDKESLFGWTPIGDVQWSVADGNLVAAGGSGGWIVTTSPFADFELIAKIRVSPKATAGLAYRAGLDGHPSENGSGVVWLSTPENANADWQEVRIVAVGRDVTATVNGQPATGQQPRRAKGYIGLLYGHNNGAKVEVSEVRLRPLGLKSLFNGQDLTGWNIIPDRKSEFSVVDGALNIKNGNGQIETAEQFKDFILQMDIMANGDPEKPLNSGVFYRSPVGVFWKGYESQIRNEFTDGDRTKPRDFGTGGNYGNQPARKVIPNEKEWFSKTIVVDGPHASVWINGYQVSDFTDMRPVSEDSQGKAGYVPGPGTITLQGHDPTTDMFFKNINIQSYPERLGRGARQGGRQ